MYNLDGKKAQIIKIICTFQVEFQDTKRLIRIHKLKKDRQHMFVAHSSMLNNACQWPFCLLLDSLSLLYNLWTFTNCISFIF